jgi:hypothetical protein
MNTMARVILGKKTTRTSTAIPPKHHRCSNIHLEKLRLSDKVSQLHNQKMVRGKETILLSKRMPLLRGVRGRIPQISLEKVFFPFQFACLMERLLFNKRSLDLSNPDRLTN